MPIQYGDRRQRNPQQTQVGVRSPIATGVTGQTMQNPMGIPAMPEGGIRGPMGIPEPRAAPVAPGLAGGDGMITPSPTGLPAGARNMAMPDPYSLSSILSPAGAAPVGATGVQSPQFGLGIDPMQLMSLLRGLNFGTSMPVGMR